MVNSIAFLYYNTNQATTTAECIAFDVCHTIWNCDVCKSCAIAERRIADACHAIWDGDARKFCATIERIFADACYAVINYYRFNG